MAKLPDEYNAEETIRRGQVARRLLSDPIMSEAFERADQLFVEEWRNATTPADREVAWSKVTALEEVQRVLQQIASNGELLEARYARDEAREELLRERRRGNTAIRRA